MHFSKLVFSFFPGIYPEVELLGYLVVLFLVFLGTSVLFPILVTPVYFLINRVQVFPLLCILINSFVDFLMITFLTSDNDISLWF